MRFKKSAEPERRRRKSVDLVGLPENTRPEDLRKMLEGDWDRLVMRVESVVDGTVEDFSVLSDLLDVFPERRDEIIEQLKRRLGTGHFNFETVKKLIRAITSGEDEVFMSLSSKGDEYQRFLERIRIPKALLVYLLFPEHRSEILDELQGAFDQISRKLIFFPGVLVKGIRLDPANRTKWDTIIRDTSLEKYLSFLKRVKADIAEDPSTKITVALGILEELADALLLYPELREKVKQEYGSILSLDSPYLPRPENPREKVTWVRAMRIIQAESAQIGDDGLIQVKFQTPLTTHSKLPERLTA